MAWGLCPSLDGSAAQIHPEVPSTPAWTPFSVSLFGWTDRPGDQLDSRESYFEGDRCGPIVSLPSWASILNRPKGRWVYAYESS